MQFDHTSRCLPWQYLHIEYLKCLERLLHLMGESDTQVVADGAHDLIRRHLVAAAGTEYGTQV